MRFSTKKWFESKGELEKWKEKYITIMYVCTVHTMYTLFYFIP